MKIRQRSIWVIPPHLVKHDGKHWIVFHCSFSDRGLLFSDQLLSGRTLGPSLLGVLLQFWQQVMGMRGTIRYVFYLLWDLFGATWKETNQVLPFVTTSIPCCSTKSLVGKFIIWSSWDWRSVPSETDKCILFVHSLNIWSNLWLHCRFTDIENNLFSYHSTWTPSITSLKCKLLAMELTREFLHLRLAWN